MAPWSIITWLDHSVVPEASKSLGADAGYNRSTKAKPKLHLEDV